MKGYARLLNLCRKKYRGIENEAKIVIFIEKEGESLITHLDMKIIVVLLCQYYMDKDDLIIENIKIDISQHL